MQAKIGLWAWIFSGPFGPGLGRVSAGFKRALNPGEARPVTLWRAFKGGVMNYAVAMRVAVLMAVAASLMKG